MVELTLPKNSRVKEGKTWPKPDGAARLKKFRIYRWDPDTGRQSARRYLLSSTSTIAVR